ncbi:MAG: adenosylmethionine decarboxylase [Candidatus Omnitrophica bacterium]|nr:adenosylmethionine decarboxylase [Candidatus Omnitrophota bacterium]
MKPLGTQVIAELINCSRKLLNDRKAVEKAVKDGVTECGISVESISSHKFDPVGVTVTAIVSESHIAVHTYPEARHVSIDIFTCSADFEKSVKLLALLKRRFQPKVTRALKVLRGNPVEVVEKEWIASASHYGFEIKYHIKKRLLSKKSKYQQIDVIENDDFGRILFLDKDVQVAEFDAPLYGESMVLPAVCGRKRLNNVAILGGGDGGVLWEVLKHGVKKVYLVDIDEEVVKTAKKYLSKICRDAFDDPRAEIVIDDANKFLEQGHRFDAVIYDLTMHPEALTKEERTAFLNSIFRKISACLVTGGIVTMQCCSKFDTETMKLLRRILPKYFKDIVFRKIFMPSFCETWVFASAFKNTD